MTSLKNSLKLNWPKSLGEVTLKNMNMTELWFLRHTIDRDEYDLDRDGIQVRAEKCGTKFGYDECYIDIEDQRYLVKHKTWVGGEHLLPPVINIVFYVRKHKNLIGK